MRVALLLAAYATALIVFGAPALYRATWIDRAPRLAIAAWQVLTASAVCSVALAGLALIVPTTPVSRGLAEFLRLCGMALRASFASPGGAALAAAGVALAAATTLRSVYCIAATLTRAARCRRQHREVLDMVAHADGRVGAVIVEHTSVAAYCLPGRGGRIVLTSAALAALDAAQLAAVLAHERAHLRARHHLAVATAVGVERAFPFVSLLRTARGEVQRLVELAADDAASRASDRVTVAAALFALAEGLAAPQATFAASGCDADRVRRLLNPHRPLGLTKLALGFALTTAALAIPAAIVAVPAVAAASMDH